MRELLWILKDVEMINVDMSAKAIVDILGRDDPKVNPEDVVDLELEVGDDLIDTHPRCAPLCSPYTPYTLFSGDLPGMPQRSCETTPLL